MSGFKLLAIRPLKGCDSRFLKVLKPNRIYKLYNNYNYEFENDDESRDVISITQNNEIETYNDLYFVEKNDLEKLPIYVSAVVGKNGSGKSTLMDFLFLAAYNWSIDSGIKFFEGKEKISDINVDIFFLAEDCKYNLKLRNGELSQIIAIGRSDKDQKDYNNSLFYTLAINYSFYGLNSNVSGKWLDDLFHKNDGYETPIVLNPFREDGNIDINKELYLSKQRLLSNVLTPNKKGGSSHWKITENKQVSFISFSINFDKIDYAFKKKINEKNYEEISFEDFYKHDNRGEILDLFYKEFFDSKPPSDNLKYKFEVEQYIIKKLIQIARTYSQYGDYFNDDLIINIGKAGDTPNSAIEFKTRFHKLSEYLSEINGDNTHITFKLRQAINYLRNDILREDSYISWQNSHEDGIIEFPVNVLSDRVKNISSNVAEIINLIPPSLFDVEVYLSDSGLEKDTTLSKLSSGEQQLIYSVQGILYHINNLNSVHKSKDRRTYQYVNLILDEIELYFHPNFQRKFLAFLLDSFSLIDLEKIKGINVLLLTHSPFILSDIPSVNILKLKEGEIEPYKKSEKTFGANVHDLLANEFFLDEGFMGEFAKDKITKTIEWINDEGRDVNLKQYYKGIIQLIGEPILQIKLAEMFDKITEESLEIELLQRRVEELKRNKLSK